MAARVICRRRVQWYETAFVEKHCACGCSSTTYPSSSTHHSDWSNWFWSSCIAQSDSWFPQVITGWFVLQLPRRNIFIPFKAKLSSPGFGWLRSPVRSTLYEVSSLYHQYGPFRVWLQWDGSVSGFYAVYVQPCQQVDCSENTWIVCVGFLWWLDDSSSHERRTVHTFGTVLIWDLFGCIKDGC